jgi:sulfur carrier protein ThiS
MRRTSGPISIPPGPSGDNTYGEHRFEEVVQVAVEILPGHREQNLEMDEKATGIDLLRKLRLAPDAHILVRRDVPIAADDALANGDRVRVIAVVSGGSGE